jgi:hypothetical protein
VVLVGTTTAYGLQLTATAITAPAAAVSQVTLHTDTHRVLIVALDPVAGDVQQTECDVPAYSFASDMVRIDAKDLPRIAAACSRTFGPELGP